jgi:hypothetical protein
VTDDERKRIHAVLAPLRDKIAGHVEDAQNALENIALDLWKIDELLDSLKPETPKAGE